MRMCCLMQMTPAAALSVSMVDTACLMSQRDMTVSARASTLGPTAVVSGVVFLSCPLVKKHADLSGSFLDSQSTMKVMHSKPTNRTELPVPMKTKSLA